MYVTTRRQDVILADIVGKFMDSHFYSILGEKWERVTNPHLQQRGVDVVFGGCKIDEKVKIKGGFANRLLEYPSFELSFVNKFEKRQLGWFLNPDSLTDYYSLIAVFGDFEDENGVNLKTITHLNALFVKKLDLIDYVNECEINVASDVEELSSGYAGDRINHSGTGIHMKLTEKFSEKPINMVVRRDVIYKFPSTREFAVYGNYVEDTISKK